MPQIEAIIEQYADIRTVLIAGASSEYPEELVRRFADAGLNVIGPVETARQALALAAQTPADLAVVSARLAGLRDGEELARRLQDTWGIPSIVLQRS